MQNHLNIHSLALIAYNNYIDFPNLLAYHGQQKTKQTRYTKNQTFNRDHKKANKQDIRYCSVDSNGQDNIHLPLLSLKLQMPILTLCIAMSIAIVNQNMVCSLSDYNGN